MEDGRIADNRITASSEHDDHRHGPRNARLNHQEAWPVATGSWSAKTSDLNQWIQADLGGLKQVSGVATQGRNGHPQWVTKFMVQYSETDETWNYIEDGNGQKVRIYKQSYK